MIVQRLLTKNKYSRVGKPLNKVWGIVVHYVGVNNQKPEDTVAYFESLKTGKLGIYASAHYVIGTDGNGIQCIPDNEVAYHCGSKEYKPGIVEKLSQYPNYTTIGVEMCHTSKGFTKETIDTATKLIAQLMNEYNLTINDIYRHYDITGKNCPRFFVENKIEWDEFRKKVEELCQ